MIRPLPVAVQMRKRGRLVTLAKIVWLIPYGYEQPVLATPYRHRRAVRDVVSLPLAVIQFAQDCGCIWWVVRFDQERRALRIRLDEVLTSGWRRTTEAGTELFVPLDRFENCLYPEWAFIETAVVLDPVVDEAPAAPSSQLSLEALP
jgi:hypothetical protein